MIKLKELLEGTCGYGIDGKIGEEPAGPNLMKKIKAISKFFRLLFKYLSKSFKNCLEAPSLDNLNTFSSTVSVIKSLNLIILVSLQSVMMIIYFYVP